VNKKKMKWISLFVVLILIVILILNLDISWLFQADLDRILDIAQDNVGIILLITLMLMMIQNLFTVIPIVLIITINISVFGLLYGFLWSWVSSIIGASVTFTLARFWFQELIVTKINSSWIDRLEKNGFLYTFLARLFPFAPSSLINLAAGVSTISFRGYLKGTMLGNLLFFLLASLFIEGFMTAGTEEMIAIAVCVIIIIGVYFYYKKRKTNHLDQTSNNNSVEDENDHHSG
jgi:uncharacterized membrane protein YdjX (TVP38/TMEM64 family)